MQCDVTRQEGDKEISYAGTLSGADWNYVLIFEAFAEVRNKMMFSPSTITQTDWTNKWAKMASDCHVKDSDTTGEQGQTVWSTANIYTIMANPKVTWRQRTDSLEIHCGCDRTMYCSPVHRPQQGTFTIKYFNGSKRLL